MIRLVKNKESAYREEDNRRAAGELITICCSILKKNAKELMEDLRKELNMKLSYFKKIIVLLLLMDNKMVNFI